MHDLAQILREKGYLFKPEFNGQTLRTDRGGRGNAWFIGRQYQVGDKNIYVAHFGDWKTGEQHEWKSEKPTNSEEALALEAAIEKKKAEERAERAATQEKISEKYTLEWETYNPVGTTPYLTHKKINALYGTKISVERTSNLLVPARDASGKLWGYQQIFPDGAKYFLEGMRIKGCFHLIGEPQDGEELYIAEGFATAASIHMATRKPVACAFNAGNLSLVATALRAKYPGKKLVV